MSEDTEKSDLIFQIHPCTEDGFVTIEAKLYLGSSFGRPGEDFFDTKNMCISLRRLRFLDKLRCSEEMGYALAEWEGKRIHVFKGGKIIIRRARDEEDARKTLNMFARTLWGSIPCICARPLVYCASGSCTECSRKVCPIHASPPFVEVPEATSKIKGGEVFQHVEKVETKDLFLKAFQKLDDFVSDLKELDKKMIEKKFSDVPGLVEKAEGSLEEACEAGTRFIIETPDDHQAALGMIFLGMAEDLGRVMDAMLMMKGGRFKVEEYVTARDIAFDSYQAFVRNEESKVSEITKRHKKFMRKKHPKPIIEIARSGFHIARMIAKPFPV
jgi:hypothetical protein